MRRQDYDTALVFLLGRGKPALQACKRTMKWSETYTLVLVSRIGSPSIIKSHNVGETYYHLVTQCWRNPTSSLQQ